MRPGTAARPTPDLLALFGIPATSPDMLALLGGPRSCPASSSSPVSERAAPAPAPAPAPPLVCFVCRREGVCV